MFGQTQGALTAFFSLENAPENDDGLLAVLLMVFVAKNVLAMLDKLFDQIHGLFLLYDLCRLGFAAHNGQNGGPW